MIPSLPIAALKIISANQEHSRLSDLINLKPGQIVNAKVLDVKPENRVQLLLSGKSEIGPGSGTLVHEDTQHLSGDRKGPVSTTSTSHSNPPGKPLPAGQKVEVLTSLSLKTGMSLTLTAVATRKGPVLKPVPSTSLASSLPLSSTGTDAALKILPGKQTSSTSTESGIKPGQTMDAKVLDVTAQNRAQLLVSGQKLSVSTRHPLVRGMDLPMKVIRSQDGIVLKPILTPSVPVSSQTAGSAKNAESPMPFVQTALPDSQTLAETKKSFRPTPFQSFSPAKIFLGLSALSQANEPLLNDILMGLSLKSDVRDDHFLPKIIENMGLSFEKKLAHSLEDAPDKKTVAQVIKQLAGQDLKAATLSLNGMESDSDKTTAKTTVNTTVLKHISDALDHFAQVNVKSGDSGQPQEGARFLLPFPVWREDGFDFGQLMVDTGKTGSANTKKMLSISFLLNMTVLGPLRADFSILDKTISGRFLLENQAICDHLIPKITDLRQRLSKIGYQAGNIDCQVARPEQIAPTSLMLSMKTPDDMHGLNIVV
ncbi:hypothetical protein [uncultured Desulfobacter sp.]|uniref:hypothetical protein n=1 Tax=uncultured Desulfobacter sp. TaxID=240139 RepID=UPI0029F57E15|nr:hypothetical protein [uncultured Desulfobacter sp.]